MVDSPMTKNELSDAIDNIKVGKAAGLDGILIDVNKMFTDK